MMKREELDKMIVESIKPVREFWMIRKPDFSGHVCAVSREEIESLKLFEGYNPPFKVREITDTLSQDEEITRLNARIVKLTEAFQKIAEGKRSTVINGEMSDDCKYFANRCRIYADIARQALQDEAGQKTPRDALDAAIQSEKCKHDKF